jgi:hypothetical protein
MIKVSQLSHIEKILHKFPAFENSLFAVLKPSFEANRLRLFLHEFEKDLMQQGLAHEDINALAHLKEIVQRTPSLYNIVKELVYDYDRNISLESPDALEIGQRISSLNLLFAVQKNTADKPYYFVFFDDANNKVDIRIVKNATSDALFVSEMYRLLNIERIEMSRLDNNMVSMGFVKGIDLLHMPRITSSEEAKIFAFFLGRALIDSSIVGLSDRGIVNMRIDVDLFKKYTAYDATELMHALNPIVNIDYTITSYSIVDHIQSNGFGPRGIFWTTLGEVVEEDIFEKEIISLGKILAEGAAQEYEKVTQKYEKAREDAISLAKRFNRVAILENFLYTAQAVKTIVLTDLIDSIRKRKRLLQDIEERKRRLQ